MLKTLCFYLACFLILVIPNQAVADEYFEMKKFCIWKSNAAQVIAMNRDIGLNETEITSNYLKQENAYTEQVIVLKLIDKIYGVYAFVTHDTIYSQTNKTCLRDFYIDKTPEVFLSQHMVENFQSQ